MRDAQDELEQDPRGDGTGQDEGKAVERLKLLGGHMKAML